MKSFNDIQTWLEKHSPSLQHGKTKSRHKAGYTVLFSGLSDSEKITTIERLGIDFGKAIYRVDLSKIVSKYIGETEKNLRAILKGAEGKEPVLYFEEADALFGKRSTVKDSHDRYANRKTRFFLELLEQYPGVVILSTRRKDHLDEAFLRRLQLVVQFGNDQNEKK